MAKWLKQMWLYWVGLILVLSVVIWGMGAEPEAYPADPVDYATLHQGWSQIVGGESVPLDDISDFQPVNQGESLVFTCTLPEIEEEDVFLFYTFHQEVLCYVGEELIHDFTMQEGYTTLKTPGTAWNQVDLTTEMSGETFTLILYSPISYYNNAVETIYFIESPDVDSARLPTMLFRILACVGGGILVVSSYINAIVWTNLNRRRYFWAQGHFYLYALIALLADLNFFDLFFHRPVVSYILAQTFLRLVPVGLWRLAVNSTDKIWHPRRMRMIRILVLCNAMVPWVLQLLFGISLLETMLLSVVIMGVVSVLLLVNIIEKLWHFRSLQGSEYPSLFIGIFGVGGATDFLLYLLGQQEHVILGSGVVVASVVYTICIYSLFAYQDSNMETAKSTLEASYQRLQTTSLMEQIKAHFIFNTLNTISALCKRAPLEADRAIRLFSTYLRSYMYLINQHELIPLERELELVQSYLMIERLRFGEAVSFTLDITTVDVYVPPLSIQPIVENAVVHGIRGRSAPGSVTISTRLVGDSAQVIISDNGVGFDVGKSFSKKGVGILNIRKRVEMMAEGTLAIESKKGQGTVVTVTVPVK